MEDASRPAVDLIKALQPETPLENKLLTVPEFVKGLFWGIPRFGHPEGEIYKHIQEVLANIEKTGVTGNLRTQLRLITFAHDTFKYLEDKSYPRDWSRHHGVYARRFLERFTDDPAVLDVTELHDEAYYSWRLIHLYHRPQAGEARLEKLLSRLGPNRQLYYLFFKCDTATGDKNPAPIKWFEHTVPDIDWIRL